MVAPGGRAWLLRGGVHGCSGGHAWLLGGHAWLLGGACMVAPGGHAWLLGGACVVAQGGHAWLLPGGACMVAWGGHAWLLGGGMRGFFDEIRSMSGRYASYWNAFLFSKWSCRQWLNLNATCDLIIL